MSGLARAVDIPVQTLEDFLAGRVVLLPEVLNALTLELFAGNAVYDLTIDRLRPALKQEPRPMGIRPETGDYITAPPSSGPLRPVVPPKSVVAGPRPGWSE